MRFLMFTKGDRSVASSRYRAYYLAEELERLGHQVSVVPATDYSVLAAVRYFRALRSVTASDVIYLQRTIYNKYFFVAIAAAYALGTRFVFDIDDAVYEHSPKRTRWFARKASLVTCGSDTISAWVRTEQAKIVVIPNGLPLSIYTPSQGTEQAIIGWIGDGPAHYENLVVLPAVFERLRSRGVAFTFRLIGSLGSQRVERLFAATPEAEIVNMLDWSDPSQAVQEMRSFAVGIMPLADTPWNQAKNFKALEYLACGIPVVASPRATLVEMLGAEKCVRFADSAEDWEQGLAELLSDRELRQRLGSNGRKLIAREYSSAIMAARLLKAVNSLK